MSLFISSLFALLALRDPRQRAECPRHGDPGILPGAKVARRFPLAASIFRDASTCLILAGSAPLQAAPTSTQVIPLTAGWNLVSVQVGTSHTPAQFKAAMTTPEHLQQIWGYNPTGNPAVPGQWNTFQPLAPPEFPSDVTAIVPGKGYWVQVSQSTSVTLTGAAWNGAVNIVPGWNLVGFPGLDLGSSEFQELSAVFGTSFDRILQVWTQNNSSKAFEGYDISAVPQLKQITGVQPGRGYWVYSIAAEPVALQGQPWVALPSDADASPPQPSQLYTGSDPKYVGRFVRLRATDGSDTPYDLNNNGILDGVETQDTLLFEISSDSVSITIGNKGGGGVVPWSLENHVSWLYTASADARSWPDGVITRPREASGTVSSETDTITLFADRAGMTPGRKQANLSLWAGGVEFPITVLLDVPEIDGDWSGSATTTRVGGRNISLGEVRLVLNAFRPDNSGPGAFRAVLNREQSILFPRDVYMEGSFLSGNQFKLTTNFEMPAGDRNAPPYANFSNGGSSDPKEAARGDRDFNGDGKVDVMNPFPFGIRREITLIGTRVTPNRLEGSYIEAIRGMLPPAGTNNLTSEQAAFVKTQFETTSQPIFIEGTFVLDRRSFEPSQRSAFSRSVQPEISIGGSGSTINVQNLAVSSPVRVQSVTLLLGMTFPDPSLLRITLVSGRGTRHVVRDFGDSSPLPSSLLIGQAFRGELADGDWSLEVEWDSSSGERGQLDSWGLEIEGLTTQRVVGRVVAMVGGVPQPIAGASLRLDGFLTRNGTTAADGTFEFDELVENDYTLTIAKPGFSSYQETFFVGEQEVNLGDKALVALDINTPEIQVAPAIGFAPQSVQFQLLLPPALAGATQVTWDFGDGSAPAIGALAAFSSVSHLYTTAGARTVSVTVRNGATVVWTGSVAVTIQRRSASPAGPPVQMIATAFVATLAARTDPAAANPAALPIPASLPGATTSHTDAAFASPMVSAIVHQESQWDSGTVDIDRSPRLAPAIFSPAAEDSDFKGQTYLRYNANLVKYEALTAAQAGSAVLAQDTQSLGAFTPYSLPAGQTRPLRFRLFTAHGGAFLGSEPSTVGNIRIQPGRTLP